MKIKVITSGTTQFDADAEYTEPAIRQALAAEDRDSAVRSAVMDTTDPECDTDDEQHITITEDDGTVLWAAWLAKYLPEAIEGINVVRIAAERDEALAQVAAVRYLAAEWADAIDSPNERIQVRAITARAFLVAIGDETGAGASS
jgi:hypothetical protein